MSLNVFMYSKPIALTLICTFFYFVSIAQIKVDSIGKAIGSKYLQTISSKSEGLSKKIAAKSEKILSRFEKQEQKIMRKLMKIDSLAANNIFTKAGESYKKLSEKYSNSKVVQYIPRFDSLATSLKFLKSNPQLIAQVKDAKEKLVEATNKLSGLKVQLAKAENMKEFIKQRKQYLKEQLGKYGFAKQLKRLNKEAYYYSQQLSEYKEMIKDPAKAEKKVLAFLSNTNVFKDFMKKNSELAALFGTALSDGVNENMDASSLSGLQTRAQVTGLVQERLAAGGPNAQAIFQQNMQSAQSELAKLKDNALSLAVGVVSNDDIMPEGFKPNTQKTKTFWNRLEYGTNIQTQKANGWFPVTSDLGLSIGYKPNDKSIIGVGASYKLGLGQRIQKLKITHEGAGLRSFIDWKIKGGFWLSGGYEMNLRPSLSPLVAQSAWQQSGLLGLSKVVSMRSKFFKKTKVQLLWDFLSSQQAPRTQPVLFRVGYSL